MPEEDMSWEQALPDFWLYTPLCLPVLPLLRVMLPFGRQGWWKQSHVLPSTVSPIALIVMLREVKRGLCTYPGASSGSRGSRCPTGKISSGHCVHQWNLLPLTHLFPVLLGFCVIWSSLMYVQKHAGFKMENFVLKDNSWHASLSHIVRLSYSLFTLALIIP